jgi:hypothetical protein
VNAADAPEDRLVHGRGAFHGTQERNTERSAGREAVAQSDQHDRDGYDRAARAAVYAMFSSLDKALENRSKLANFSK